MKTPAPRFDPQGLPRDDSQTRNNVHWLLRHEGWRGRVTGAALGALAVCGQAPLHIWPLALVCFALLYARLHYAAQSKAPHKAGFHSAIYFAIGYFGVSIFWVGSAFIARGPAFIPIMPPMVLGLALLLAMFWAIAGRYYARLIAAAGPNTGGLLPILAFTSFFFLAEFTRGHVFGGLPWNLPGYIFEAGSAPSQIAAWVNIYGLSWFVLLVAACFGQVFYLGLSGYVSLSGGFSQRLKTARVQVSILSTAGLCVLLSLFAYGSLRLSGAQPDYVDGVKLRLVSVPFDQAEHFDPQSSHEIVSRFFAQSLAPGIEDVTHLVWPEGAVLGLAMDDYGLLRAMGQSLVQYDDTPPVWLMQSTRLESMPNPRGQGVLRRYYNSSVAVSFDAKGNPAISVYNDKYKLVPFGEFIPGANWLGARVPVLSASLTSLSPAKRKELSNYPGLPRVSAQICYEAVFPGLTPWDDKNPAKVILNQSNDAWYGKSWGPWQHANIARYRALEQGIPMIRVAANGVSGVVDPYGKLQAHLTFNDEAYIDTQLPHALSAANHTKVTIWILFLINLGIGLLCSWVVLVKRAI